MKENNRKEMHEKYLGEESMLESLHETGGKGEDWLHPGPREPRPEQGKG
jgi:hypothetical protein